MKKIINPWKGLEGTTVLVVLHIMHLVQRWNFMKTVMKS